MYIIILHYYKLKLSNNIFIIINTVTNTSHCRHIHITMFTILFAFVYMEDTLHVRGECNYV